MTKLYDVFQQNLPLIRNHRGEEIFVADVERIGTIYAGNEHEAVLIAKKLTKAPMVMEASQ